jgi:hypothetical protein
VTYKNAAYFIVRRTFASAFLACLQGWWSLNVTETQIEILNLLLTMTVHYNILDSECVTLLALLPSELLLALCSFGYGEICEINGKYIFKIQKTVFGTLVPNRGSRFKK